MSWVSVLSDRPTETQLPKWSKKTLFSKRKHSDEWHHNIDFLAGVLRPSDSKFPWILIKKHTDHYIKKKGKISQAEIDVRLATLIERHEARDVAIAACAHAISPTGLRALLNVELNVAPATYYGLEMYLQSLIAANYCSPKAVTGLEVQWARQLLPYAKHGAGVAGRYLEGLCSALRAIDTPNMNVLPDFAILARRAFKNFATQLEGYKLRSQWVSAQAAVGWMSALARTTPAVTPPGHLLPEHVLDAQFPIWRIWVAWNPNTGRTKSLAAADSARRAVIPDMMALEGPDFINGTHATLRDGLVAQYGAEKAIVRFRGLVIEVPNCTKEELKIMLDRTGALLETALKGDDGPFMLFVELTVKRPVTQESLQLLEALNKIQDTPKFHVHNAVLEIWLAQHDIGGRHISALQHLICGLDDPQGEELQKVLLRPWLVGGIEKCLKECYAAVRTHIETGLAWTHLAIELHSLCAIVKGSKKCLSLLPSDIRKQLDVLPTVEYLRTLAAIYTSAGGEKVIETDSGANNLKNSIEAWCIDRLMERGTINHASEKTVETMVQVWDQVNNPDRQTLAILVSKCTGTDFTLRCRCLSQISTLSGGFVNTVLAILQDFKSRPEINCIGFIKLLANTQDAEVVQCFKRILYHMIESLQPTAIIDYSFQHLKASEWSQLMLQLSALFSDEIMNPSASPPFILQPHLHLWVQQLSAFLPVIARLEDILGPHAIAVKTILRGGEGLWVEHLVKLLEALTSASGYPAEKLMQQIVGKLSKEGNNASEVADCLKALLGTTPEGLAACERIYNAKHGLLNMPGLGSPPQTPAPTPASPMKLPRKPVPKAAPAQQEDIPVAVIEVIIAGYLQDDGFCGKAAIRVLAFLLNLEIYEWGIPKHKLRQATAYFAEQEMKLLEEVDRLQSLQKALRARDPKGTAILLAELGVDDISPLDDEIAGLPVGVMDAVEKHGDNEVGISFPFTSYTDLQRGAMGLGSAKTLLVRLFLDYLTDMPPAFCIHLDADPGETHSQHTPWVCLAASKSPEQVFCSGKSTSFTWQMGRIVHRYLKDKKGPVGIADLHGFVKQSMEDMTHGCVVCGQTHNARNTQLRRSTPCTSSGCTRIWNNVPVDIRIPELRTDTFAVDMILTTVYAAAMSGRTELLPGCPISNTTTVTAILNALPNLNTLRVATNISATLQACHQQAEKLLVWACTHFRGFIATASGICKIPGMPAGTHQFILANASPRLESDFAAKLPRFNPQTKVLFHGTSLDRLQSILVQGLKIYSGTALQRTGAAHGKGIYMAEEPATSFSYSPAAVSWRNSGLNNMRLLLGCEVVGNGRSVSSGIHVITDEKTVMVRYIFLLTNSSYAPNANHITPAMGSAMTALRSGTV